MSETPVLWTPQSPSIHYLIRKAIPEDIPFITNSWLKSYRQSGDVKMIPNNQYFHYQHKMVEHLVPKSIVLVAADKDDMGIIKGWICAEVIPNALLLHFVYVKNDYRRMGIGSALLRFIEEYEQPPVVITTHSTLCLHDFMESIGDAHTWFHNRFLAFNGLPKNWGGQ